MTLRPPFAAASVAFDLGLGFGPSALAQDPTSALPDGPGKAELIKGCTSCHDATTISGMPRSPDAWERVIGDMIGNGAELTADEHAAVLAYLVKNFSTPGSAPSGAAPATPPAPAPAPKLQR